MKKKIKTRAIKTATNSQLSTTQSKKQTKQITEQEQNHRYKDHLEHYQLRGARRRGSEEKGAEIKKHKLVGTK